MEVFKLHSFLLRFPGCWILDEGRRRSLLGRLGGLMFFFGNEFFVESVEARRKKGSGVDFMV